VSILERKSTDQRASRKLSIMLKIPGVFRIFWYSTLLGRHQMSFSDKCKTKIDFMAPYVNRHSRRFKLCLLSSYRTPISYRRRELLLDSLRTRTSKNSCISWRMNETRLVFFRPLDHRLALKMCLKSQR